MTFAQVAPTAPAPITVILSMLKFFRMSAYQIYLKIGQLQTVRYYYIFMA
jgi:hypothetical protein